MYWIFPRLKKWILRKYRAFLRFVFWGISQELKKIKRKYLESGRPAAVLAFEEK